MMPEPDFYAKENKAIVEQRDASQFTAKEKKIFASLSRRMARFGLVFVLIGVVRLIEISMLWPDAGMSSEVIRMLIKAGYYFLSGAIVWSPTINFKRVVTSSGDGITDVLGAIEKMTTGLTWIGVLLILNMIVLLIDIGDVL